MKKKFLAVSGALLAAVLFSGCGASPSAPVSASTPSPVAKKGPVDPPVQASSGDMTFERTSVGSVAAPVKPSPDPASQSSSGSQSSSSSSGQAAAASGQDDSVLAAGESASQWAAVILANAHVSDPVPIQFVPQVICNGEVALGCTQNKYTLKWQYLSTDWIQVASYLVGTPKGKFVVLHESGHANGIVSECGADAFAIAHGADPAQHVYNCG